MDRKNLLRTVYFEKPDYIPTTFHINPACWHHYPQDALQELMASHPFLFPDFEPLPDDFIPVYSPTARANKAYEDYWGCIWETTENGIVGTVTHHPLADWDALDDFMTPDPNRSDGILPIDWTEIKNHFDRQKTEDELPQGSLIHGHTFLLLSYLRGYENLIFDMVDADPRLFTLIALVEEFNLFQVKKYLACGAEWIGYPEDLGMQVGPMLSLEHFRKYIKPSYQRLMQPARDNDCIIHMHSDGDIRDLIDDIIEGGVQVINLQDLVNGIDWIKAKLTGKVCVDLDIDRQQITQFGTPGQIDELIRREVRELGSKSGGLMFTYGLYPGIRLENVKALMDALERYATFY